MSIDEELSQGIEESVETPQTTEAPVEDFQLTEETLAAEMGKLHPSAQKFIRDNFTQTQQELQKEKWTREQLEQERERRTAEANKQKQVQAHQPQQVTPEQAQAHLVAFWARVDANPDQVKPAEWREATRMKGIVDEARIEQLVDKRVQAKIGAVQADATRAETIHRACMNFPDGDPRKDVARFGGADIVADLERRGMSLDDPFTWETAAARLAVRAAHQENAKQTKQKQSGRWAESGDGGAPPQQSKEAFEKDVTNISNYLNELDMPRKRRRRAG